MKRREILTLLRGVVARPLAACAQNVARLLTIGLLGTDAATRRPWTAPRSCDYRTGWLALGAVDGSSRGHMRAIDADAIKA
jgi:hypothetical protein